MKRDPHSLFGNAPTYKVEEKRELRRVNLTRSVILSTNERIHAGVLKHESNRS